MRPPGHHATREQSMGFCYLNNIAIAVLEARATGAKRVAVFDFDVHHGNGTEDILLNRPGVEFFSVHQHPAYPGHRRGKSRTQLFQLSRRAGRAALTYRAMLAHALDDLKHLPARPRRRVRRLRRLRARPAGGRHAAGGGFSLARRVAARVDSSVLQPARRRLQPRFAGTDFCVSQRRGRKIILHDRPRSDSEKHRVSRQKRRRIAAPANRIAARASAQNAAHEIVSELRPRALTAPETDSLRELVKRRGQREPLQHITGSTSFCGYEIAVSRHALVPRPETELLAELGWKFLLRTRNSANSDHRPGFRHWHRLHRHRARGEMSERQNHRAGYFRRRRWRWRKQNAAQNQSRSGLNFCTATVLRRCTRSGNVRFALSNPPYIPSAEIATLEPEVSDFDPRGALDGGADGLDFYRRLATEAKPFLKPDGKIMLEFGDGQAEASENF